MKDLLAQSADLIRNATSLDETIYCAEKIANLTDGQITASFNDGEALVIHKKEDTLELLQRQKYDLINRIRSVIDSIDDRPRDS